MLFFLWVYKILSLIHANANVSKRLMLILMKLRCIIIK